VPERSWQRPNPGACARTFLAVALPAHGRAGGSSCLPAENTVTARTGPWFSPSPVAALNFRNTAVALQHCPLPPTHQGTRCAPGGFIWHTPCLFPARLRCLLARQAYGVSGYHGGPVCSALDTIAASPRRFFGGHHDPLVRCLLRQRKGGSAQPNRGTRRWMLTKARWRLPCGRS
jgi:hypothetical protein